MKRRMSPVLPARTRWTALVAVCGECNGGKRFAKALRRAMKRSATEPARVVRSSCLDVCPKRGVTVATLRDSGVITVVVNDELEGAADDFSDQCLWVSNGGVTEEQRLVSAARPFGSRTP
jgi:hypothetical protein